MRICYDNKPSQNSAPDLRGNVFSWHEIEARLDAVIAKRVDAIIEAALAEIATRQPEPPDPGLLAQIEAAVAVGAVPTAMPR
ncbi:hypothetical protein THIOM_001927 [Candidatus Thiomargarita nelsonii]|uniref:Uncharacterized protein n=1 Tax=Candidatus Thiomargarita nelsonii TaxID=1003181 RepID=A0A0A6P112_9GAMM|nr:hypothetical protein THIOM_001927 [Candidatus Thiomargarita nelsonii]